MPKEKDDAEIRKTPLGDYQNSKKHQDVQTIIFERLTRSLIAEGLIKTRGLSKAQIQSKAAEYILQHQPTVVPVIDHSDLVLEQAESHVTAKSPQLAILFYATWTEHIINSIISIYGRRRRLELEEVTQIIRETNFRAKLTWLLKLLKAPPIPEVHLKVLGALMESRNSFVHYKWKPSDVDAERAAQRKLLAEFRKSKKFLDSYADKHVFKGYKYDPKPSSDA